MLDVLCAYYKIHDEIYATKINYKIYKKTQAKKARGQKYCNAIISYIAIYFALMTNAAHSQIQLTESRQRAMYNITCIHRLRSKLPSLFGSKTGKLEENFEMTFSKGFSEIKITWPVAFCSYEFNWQISVGSGSGLSPVQCNVEADRCHHVELNHLTQCGVLTSYDDIYLGRYWIR